MCPYMCVTFSRMLLREGMTGISGVEAYSHLAVRVSDINWPRLSPCTGSPPIPYALVEHPCPCPEQCQGLQVFNLWLEFPGVPNGSQLACAVRLHRDHSWLNQPYIIGSR